MTITLLDTNAYSNLLRGNSMVQNLLEESSMVLMSVVVIGELLAGFRIGQRFKENNALLQKFLNHPIVRVSNCTMNTAETFAIIKSQLKELGKPIPINDVWIAAQCIENQSKLITFDSHFEFVDGLQLERLHL